VVAATDNRSARKSAMAAGATLLVMMAGHTVLETARDSLFLTRLPVTQLPWTYAMIAVAILLALEFDAKVARRVERRRLLVLTLLIGGAGSAAFYFPFRAHLSWAPYAFYVWIGVVASLAVGEFWLLLSNLFAVADAKQFYGRIGAGGLLGGLLGGALAHAAASYLGDQALVVLGGALVFVSAFAPGLRGDAAPGPTQVPPSDAGSSAAVRDLRSERYLRRLLVITLLATLSGTLVDYVFKAEVARSMVGKDLGRFFGSWNAALSGLALLAQFTLAPRLLGAVGVGRALLVLPSVLLLSASGALIAPGLIAAMVLRGGDGTLRNSIQRGAVEVLYLPLPSRARARWKMLVDALGQRGGQALASMLILSSVAAGAPPWFLVALVVLLTAAWLALSVTIEQHYIALFRAKIKAGAIETRADVPALDLRSLESLVSALGSDNDDEVLATIDLLVDFDRAHVIPALLLLHPSRAVVVRTLEVLANSGRKDFLGAARRLLARDDDEVRAAAMLALSRHTPPEELRRELERALPMSVRAAVLVAALSRDLDHDGSYRSEVERGCAPGADAATRLSFARALRLSADARFSSLVAALAVDAGPGLDVEVARAMLAAPSADFIPHLLVLLRSRGARSIARDALVAIGDPALAALARAFDDPALPRQLRAHLPRSVSRFHSAAAADILLDRLDHETTGWVRFKCIRGLGQLREHMHEPARRRRVLQQARSNLSRAAHFIAWRMETEADRAADPRLSTRGGDLLVSVLREKELHAVDRAVRLAGVLHSTEVMHDIRQALGSADLRFRADGLELLVHVVPHDMARAFAALLSGEGDGQRLQRVTDALDETIAPTSYQQRLDMMLHDASEAVRSVAAFHVGELGMIALAQSFDAAALRASGLSDDVFARVGALLQRAIARGKGDALAVPALGGQGHEP
jgi:AAA family ATP:ADP antiporter